MHRGFFRDLSFPFPIFIPTILCTYLLKLCNEYQFACLYFEYQYNIELKRKSLLYLFMAPFSVTLHEYVYVMQDHILSCKLLD
jgi:hypothetical protein